MKVIEAKGLSKSYGPVVALKDVSFAVEKGEVIGLLGPNGAGKTTLMKILTGFMQSDEGTAEICGVEVSDDPFSTRSKIGYLPESAPLYRDMTVQAYLLMMCELRNVPVNKRRGYLNDAIEATGLGEYLTRFIGQLSKGYRQRVGLAQALMHRPEVLILDEPTSGLDPNQIVEIRELIKTLSQRSTVMLSTHILSEVELTCERVLMIMRGRLSADDNVRELRAANAAIIAVHRDAADVEARVRHIDGIDSVERTDEHGEYWRWRVTSQTNDALCPALFQAAAAANWQVSELRSDTRTLESVFRELAQASQERLA